MKFFRLLLALLVFSIIVISSCQKELNFDEVSSGTLVDSAGDCHPSIINGIYRVDSALGNGNYIDVQVNANIPGVTWLYLIQ
jgi:hypothetical protein